MRPAYKPADYSVPASVLAKLRDWPYSVVDELEKHDGVYSSYTKISEVEHDGKPYYRMVERSKGFLLDVEITTALKPDLRPLPPEDAWVYGRTRDKLAPGYVPIEASPPPGVTDPYPSPASK